MILHIVPGLDNPFNGIAVAAKLIANEQAAKIVDARELGKIKDLAEYEEVWVHSCWLPKTLVACWKVLRAKRPLVRMTHANLDPVRLRYHGWKKWLVGPIERYFLRKADRIVVTCEAEAEWVRMYLGKNCPKIVVTDLKRFFDFNRVERADRVEGDSFWSGFCGEDSLEFGNNQKRGTRNKKLHALYLGRRHSLKGVGYLEKAVAELNNDFVNLVQEDSTRSTRLKIELKIVSNAFGEEKEEAWEWCDVLVLPTLSENFGLVVAEALERGKRVITTDGAPAWEGDSRHRESKMNTENGNVLNAKNLPAHCSTSALNFDSKMLSRFDGRLLYLKEYRDGNDADRVRLLKDAIRFYLGQD